MRRVPVSLLYGTGAIFRGRHARMETAMLDVILVAVGVGFFVAAVLYVVACERM